MTDIINGVSQLIRLAKERGDRKVEIGVGDAEALLAIARIALAAVEQEAANFDDSISDAEWYRRKEVTAKLVNDFIAKGAR